jgi:polyferredoxin
LYGGLLFLLFSGFVYSMSQRVPLSIELLRDRNALYRITGEGHIENIYTLKILNMDVRNHVYRIRLGGMPGATLAGIAASVAVNAGQILSMPLAVKAETSGLRGGIHDLTLTLESVEDPGLGASTSTRFFIPAR